VYARSIAEEEKALQASLSRQKAYTDIDEKFKKAFYTIASMPISSPKNPSVNMPNRKPPRMLPHAGNLPPRHALVKMTKDVSQTIYPLYTPDKPHPCGKKNWMPE